ncbi:hypothetical protein P7K49_002607 [Saguinus oedipus]|uniref:Basic proline-rich protein-like n=1 Tax=Saguinus oedipus TaxID=9490 RepID=A0ABQ9WIS9_SAGOE|nr:hypothetical protein P7K49_002607 [Saguinus oedipus]
MVPGAGAPWGNPDAGMEYWQGAPPGSLGEPEWSGGGLSAPQERRGPCGGQRPGEEVLPQDGDRELARASGQLNTGISALPASGRLLEPSGRLAPNPSRAATIPAIPTSARGSHADGQGQSEARTHPRPSPILACVPQTQFPPRLSTGRALPSVPDCLFLGSSGRSGASARAAPSPGNRPRPGPSTWGSFFAPAARPQDAPLRPQPIPAGGAPGRVTRARGAGPWRLDGRTLPARHLRLRIPRRAGRRTCLRSPPTPRAFRVRTRRRDCARDVSMPGPPQAVPAPPRVRTRTRAGELVSGRRERNPEAREGTPASQPSWPRTSDGPTPPGRQPRTPAPGTPHPGTRDPAPQTRHPG